MTKKFLRSLATVASWSAVAFAALGMVGCVGLAQDGKLQSEHVVIAGIIDLFGIIGLAWIMASVESEASDES